MSDENNFLDLLQKKSGMNRRTFLKTIGSSLAIMGLPIQMRSAFADPTTATAVPDHVTLTWAAAPETTQTISWRTDTTVSKGLVRLSQGASTVGRGAATSFQTVNAGVETLQSSLGAANLHSVTLTGLRPGTTYSYQVGDGTNWSTVSTFTTAQTGATSFKFLVFGDSQSGMAANPEYGPWQSNVHAAFAANPDAKFLINVGDLCEDGQDYLHWNNWYKAAQDILCKIPAMPSEGNHETYNNGWIPPSGSTSEPYEYIHQFKVPQNGPAGLKGQTYSWDYGNVHIAVIDSQYDEEVTSEQKARFPGAASTVANPLANPFIKLQADWLDNDLKTSTKPWKIVIFHKTPYYNKESRSNEIIKAAFTPIFDKYHVDVVFNGHDHGVSRTYPIKNDVFQSNPGKGTVYYVTGRGGNKYYIDLSKKVWDQFFFDANDMPCHIVVQVNGNSLTLRAVKQNGVVIDTYTINKSGSDYPATVLPAPYSKTRVIVYGNDSKVDAVQNGATWYIPLDFVKVNYVNSNYGATFSNGEYVGGTPHYTLGVTPATYSSNASKASFTVSSVAYTFTVGSTTVGGTSKTLTSPAIYQNGMVMISAEDVKNIFGFSYRYDISLNAIFLVK